MQKKKNVCFVAVVVVVVVVVVEMNLEIEDKSGDLEYNNYELIDLNKNTKLDHLQIMDEVDLQC